MKFTERLLVDIKNRPQEFFIGSCVFFVPVMGTSVKNVASTCFALLLLYSFYIIKEWKLIWQRLSHNEKWLLKGFALYAFLGLLAYINVQNSHDYFKVLERYMRFLLAIPIYLLIRKYNVNIIKYLYAGVIVSGPFLLTIAAVSYFNHPDQPACGEYHHIIFGSVAMLNVGIMLSVLLTQKINNITKAIIVISMLSGFVAAVLSQSRGVWLALPVYVLITLYYSVKYSRIKLSSVLIVSVLIVAILLLSPIGKMVKTRTDAAIDDISAFYDKGQYISSLGTRLAMWNIAIDTWKRHPVIGSGPGDFEDTIIELQKKGEYTGMDVHNSAHSMYFQSIADTGSVGIVILLFSLLFMPLKLLFNSIKQHQTMALSGIVLILLFATVGLSASWTLRLPTVSVYIVYMLAIVSGIFTLAGNDSDEMFFNWNRVAG
ncbi:MAG: O-antigen ligase family protein, partial [Gammaproteobacteria bacterium]|nr:O-antigen ligase family protein [Gammaproteobacteria bacterium]